MEQIDLTNETEYLNFINNMSREERKLLIKYIIAMIRIYDL